MLERLSLHVRLESIPARRRRVPYRAAWKFGTLDRSLARRSLPCGKGKFLGRLQVNTSKIAQQQQQLLSRPRHM
jgi:hypothetical protein